MSIKVCIVGCGDMGKHHAKAWSARGDSEIVAVCDASQAGREKLATQVGATGYERHEDAIGHPGVEVVSICLPVCFHCEVACFAARAGKHVLCEKPLALTLEQADEMIAVAAEHRVLLSTAF